MRVIVDTNVIVSGLISPRAAPARIVDAVLQNRVIAAFSTETFAELGEVLRRPKLKRFLSREGVNVPTMLAQLRELGEFVRPSRVPAALRDAGDLPFLAVAASRPAPDYLITGDRDFDRPEYFGVTVVSPTAFVRQILSAA